MSVALDLNELNFDNTVSQDFRSRNASLRKRYTCHRIKNAAQKAISSVGAAFRQSLLFLSHSLKDLSGVRTVLKLGKSTVDFVKNVFEAESTGTNNLRSQLAVADGVLGIADFIADIKIWFVPSEDPLDLDNNGKAKKKMFWNHEGETRVKIASKIFGTLSKVVGLGKFIVDIGIVKLGGIAAAMNKIPFFRVVLKFSPVSVIKDTFDIVSDSLSLVSQGFDIAAEKTKGRIHQTKLTVLKYAGLDSTLQEEALRKKYKDMQTDFATLENRFLTSAKRKYIQLKNHLKDLGLQYIKPGKANEDHDAKWDHLQNKYLIVLANANDNNRKVEKHTKIVKNTRKKQIKNWINVAHIVTRIVAATLGIIGIAASISFLPAFIGVMATLWLAASIIGFAKMYYSYRNRESLKST